MPSKGKVTVGMKVTYSEAERLRTEAKERDMSLDKYLHEKMLSTKDTRLVELGNIYEIKPDRLVDFIEDLLRDGKIVVEKGKAKLV